MTDPLPLHILCVCTGNVCRSPAAERLLADRLGWSTVIRSAGTRALVGQPVALPMQALMEGFGIDAAAFRARQLDTGHIRPAQLVLGMTRAHRGDVVELWPKAVPLTFTLKEFARLLRDVDPQELPEGSAADRLRAAIPLARARRQHVADARKDDVIDPYRREPRVYAEAFDDIVRAVDDIAEVAAPNAPHGFQ